MTFPYRRTLRAAITLAVAAALLALAPAALAASTAGFDDDELVVLGSDVAQNISITRTAPNTYRVTDNTGITPAVPTATDVRTGCVDDATDTDSNAVICTDPTPPATGAKSMRVAAFGGDDVLSAGPGQTSDEWGPALARMIGRGGDDRIYGSPVDDELDGAVGNDVVDGGPGNDIVSGGGEFVDGSNNMGLDQVYGGPGDDTVSDGEAAGDIHDGDTLDGGVCPATAATGCANRGGEVAGDEDILFLNTVPNRATRTGNITVNLNSSTAGEAGEANAIARFESVETGDGNDTVIGTSGRNMIATNGGNDNVDSGIGTADDIDCGLGAKDQLVPDGADTAVGCEITDDPPPPGSVTATANGQNAITVSWADNATAISYEVVNASGTVVGTTTGTSAQVSGLSAGTRYCFTVRSVNRFGTSGSSTQACATTSSTPAPPATGGGGSTAGGGGGTATGGGSATSQATVTAAARSAAASAASALKRARLRRLLGGGTSVRGSVPAAGRVTYTVRGKGITIARKAITRLGAGSYSLRLKGSKAARNRLRNARRLTITITVRYTTSDGLASTATRKVTLRR